ncbi:MAG: hypothetical protein KDK90_27525 [Leptospiraceae bacterium]|nr:hypothetical protein [Leptospiraceae bacterium]
MKIILRYFVIILIFITKTCWSNDKYSSDVNNGRKEVHALILLLNRQQVNQLSIKAKVKNTSGHGYLEMNFQGNVVRVESDGEQSNNFISISSRNGKYSITTGTDGAVLESNNFDYKGTFNDGVIIREDSKVEDGKCYLFNGTSGKIEEINCE